MQHFDRDGFGIVGEMKLRGKLHTAKTVDEHVAFGVGKKEGGASGGGGSIVVWGGGTHKDGSLVETYIDIGAHLQATGQVSAYLENQCSATVGGYVVQRKLDG